MPQSTFGFEQVVAYTRRLPGKMRAAGREALTDMALAVEKEVKLLESGEGSGLAEWPDLRPATIHQAEWNRTAKGRRTTQRDRGAREHMLNVSGDMMRRVTHVVGSDEAIVGSGLAQEIAHEFGTTRAGVNHSVVIPKRPHFGPAVRKVLPGVEPTFIKRVQDRVR